MKTEMHAILRGHVQGVGFRATAQMFAKEKGLVGTVKNLPDGTVELYAQGIEEDLKELIHRLNEYFELDDQEHSTQLVPIKTPFSDFRIVH